MADDNPGLVKLQDPSGQLVNVTPSDAEALKLAGYSAPALPTPAEFDQSEKEKEFSSPLQKAATAIEGAGEGATFGLSTGLETAMGMDPADIRARREVNPNTHALGQAAGLVGSAVLGTGEAKVLGMAGEGAASALGLTAEGGLASRMGYHAVKNAAETMLFSGGDELSKMISGDPNQTVGSVAANVGLSGLLGGGIGAGVGVISPLWTTSASGSLTNAVHDMENQVADVTANGLPSIPETAPVEPAVEAAAPVDPNQAQSDMVQEAAGMQKPNADEIAGAAERLGIKPSVGTMSDSKFIQDTEQNLTRRPTIAGQAMAREVSANEAVLKKAATEVLSDATTKSEYETGKAIESGVADKLQKIYAPIKASFEQLEPHLKAMEVPEALKFDAVKQLVGMGTQQALDLAEEIQKQGSVWDLKTLRTSINERLSDAYRGGYRGASADIEPLQAAKNALTGLREGAIDAASKATGLSGKEAGRISAETIQQLRETDAAYRLYKEKLKNVGVEAGLGNIGSARKLLDQMAKRSSESWSSRIFNAGDVEQTRFFKENFPDEFELARKYKLKDILEKSISEAQGRNGAFDVGSFLRQLSDTKYGPEARDMLLGDKSQKLMDIKTMYQAMPGVANPSGTAAAIASGNLFSVQGAVDNASDAVKYAVLKGLPRIMEATGVTNKKAAATAALMYLKAGQPIEAEGFKAMTDYIAHAAKGENLAGAAAKNIFKAGAVVLPANMYPSDKETDKLDRKLQSLQDNPTPLYDVGGKTAHYMPEHGEAIGQTAGNAVQYLNSLRPQVQKPNPLDAGIEPSKQEKAAYRDALTIAEQPLVVMDKIKEGTLVPSDLKHLGTLYPGLYSNLQQKLTHSMIDAVHAETPIPYQTRLGLSMFLAQPLDSTMTPGGIQAAQPQAPQMPPPGGQSAPRGSHAGSMKNITKLPSDYMTPQQKRISDKQAQ